MKKTPEKIVIGTIVDISTRNTRYRGMDMLTGNFLFERGPFIGHTNNCAGFLAIVHALAYCRAEKLTADIYCSNSQAIEWVKARGVTSHIIPTKIREEYVNRINQATEWLKTHIYSNQVLHWNQKELGENPATYSPKKKEPIGRRREPEEKLVDMIKDSKRRHA